MPFDAVRSLRDPDRCFHDLTVLWRATWRALATSSHAVTCLHVGFSRPAHRRAPIQSVRDLVTTDSYNTVGISYAHRTLFIQNLIANLPDLPQPAALPECSITPAAARHAYTGPAATRRARIPTHHGGTFVNAGRAELPKGCAGWLHVLYSPRQLCRDD